MVLGAETGPETGEWTVLAHLDARGGLSAAAARYQQVLTAHRGQLAGLAIQLVEEPQGQQDSRVRRWQVAADGRRMTAETWGRLPDAEPGTAALSSFLRWGARTPGHGRVLVLVLGHGGRAGSSGLTARQLRQALAASRQSQPCELLALDMCYRGSLETLCELRGVTRYLTVAPGVIVSPGLDWDAVLERIGATTTGRELARELVQRGGPAGTGALVAVDLTQLGAVLSAATALAEGLQREIERDADLVALLRSRTMSWGEHQEWCDVAALARGLECNLEPGTARQAAQALVQALQGLTVGEWLGRTPQTVQPIGGLGVYFPTGLGEMTDSWEMQSEFGRVTGWSTFLRSYWSHMQGKLTPVMP